MFSRFFIDRPIFATVLSIVILIVGGVALRSLPIAQYPEVVPPVIQISAIYPGASAKVVADTVATPIEQEVNGVENMLYMFSKSTNDGQMYLDVTFNVGTDLNMAQVLTQNRVSIAEAKLPEEVKRQGVTTKKKSPAILLCVNLVSPDKRYDQLYLSNYATIQVKDALARLPGVGDVAFLGARDYSMRIWLDPEKLASRNMTAGDVTKALKEQNVQVAAGRLGQTPAPPGQESQLTVNTLGRLLEPEQFADVIVKTGSDGQITRVRDVGRTELGAKNYDVDTYLDGQACITMAVYQLPGSNALATAEAVRSRMEELKARFPAGLDYRIVYDTTVFVSESIHEVYKTLFEAFILVFIVVLIFLQSWRATIVPMVAVPVSLIGTFAVMAGLGFSLNNLSLFGLVLAIGIVVDDAIVVVENVERNMAAGMNPPDAARKAMDEVSGALIAIALVLSSVFVPTAFITGISGEFYRQFALTIATSTIISAFNSLTLSPALCALILKSHGQSEHGHAHSEALPRLGLVVLVGLAAYNLLTPVLAPVFGVQLPAAHGEEAAAAAHGTPAMLWVARAVAFAIGAVAGWLLSGVVNHILGLFFQGFNWVFDRAIGGYGMIVSVLLRVSLIVLIAYGGLMYLTAKGFATVPVGFIPEQDKGYLVVNAQLPDGASLERSQDVQVKLVDMVSKTPGVAHTISVPGYSILMSTNISNVGGMFVILEPFEKRKEDPDKSSFAIARRLRGEFQHVQEAVVSVFGAPPVDGLGNTGGFKMQLQDRADAGLTALQENVDNMVTAGNGQPGLVGLFSSFRANQPQLYVDLDRTQAKSLGVSLNDAFETLQTYLGSTYVNDFTRFGRNWQVNVQADAKFRLEPEDIGQLKVRNASGKMVPLGSLLSVRDISGPAIVNHYNMYPSAEVSGGTAPGVSSGQGISMMEGVAGNQLPSSMGFEWTELALQQRLAGNTAIFVFILGAIFVFLVLSAQYESWSLPLAIILIVPMCLLAAITGVWLMKMDNNIFTQIGLVVLIGLAAKNAILIVEFAKQLQDEGRPRRDATIEASKLRLRPILMTSFAFTLGVVPLALAAGAGAEMRVALGVAVFSGMVGVTAFGIFFTPVFYSVVRWLTEGKASSKPSGSAAASGASPSTQKTLGGH
ncbi:MAG: multidrug efflux RND transporter permease subunit [Phycisphaerae bacterium]|nr:multidrug efflux RND transporter permease subunit [Phycisphaerae bacterium]